MPMRGCQIQIAAGPCRRNRFGRLAESDIETCLHTPRELERRLAARIVQGYPFTAIPQHRINALAAAPKAQAARAAPPEHPTVRPLPWRRKIILCCNALLLLAPQDRRACCRHVE